VSAQTNEDLSNSPEGSDRLAGRPVLRIIEDGAKTLGEMPAPTAEPAFDPKEQYHFDGPIPKFERGGTGIPHDADVIVTQQNGLLAESVVLSYLR
jgi:hypothetical protein